MALAEHVMDPVYLRNVGWRLAGSHTQEKAVNDWGCVSEGLNPDPFGARYPGYRYGLTRAVKPMVVIKPCACPGGVLQPPMEYDYGLRDSDGLWHVRPHGKLVGFFGAQAGDVVHSSCGGSSTRRNGGSTRRKALTSSSLVSQIGAHEDGYGGWQMGLLVRTHDDVCDLRPLGARLYRMPSTQKLSDFVWDWVGAKVWDRLSGMLSSVVQVWDKPATPSSKIQRNGSSTTFADKDNIALPTFSAMGGQEPYSMDFGCVKGPKERGKDAGARMGEYWVTALAETDCPCDTEEQMLVNHVQKPTVDVIYSPTTLQTFRAMLKMDFPLEQIPNGYISVAHYMDYKASHGQLASYFENRGSKWIFHGYRGDQDVEGSRQANGIMNLGVGFV